MMSSTSFTLSDATLTARPSGALWWEDAGLLCVTDLHLGKSERMARRGGSLLPPYETTETLARLRLEIEALDPRAVICLGDSFDDNECVRWLDDHARSEISALMSGRRWIWIAGTHDPSATELGGSYMAEVQRGPLTFRHVAEPRFTSGEISGHYHPKARVPTRGGTVSRPCFVHDGERLILPAFGLYTGGLGTDEADLGTLFGEAAVCILTGERTTTTVPLRPRLSA